MTSTLTFTGERFLPDCSGEIAYEHWHRYAFARSLTAGKRVLDAACGEGYGSALLGQTAAAVYGVDIDAVTIEHARPSYGKAGRIEFVTGSCVSLPFPDASFDVIVSFETIEHLRAEDQPRMLLEFARVLAPQGCIVVSSPNKLLYSDARNYDNEFHLHELYREGFERLLAPHFPAQRWFRQRLGFVSGIWTEDDATTVEAWQSDGSSIRDYAGPDAMYFVVVAAREHSALPRDERRVSLFVDANDSELKRTDQQAREVLRLDALLKLRDSALDKQTHHIHHLEQLLEQHGRILSERDAGIAHLQSLRAEDAQELARRHQVAVELRAQLDKQVAELEGEIMRLSGALGAQERIIEYRQSARWWLVLPWLRVRRWWSTVRS